jgi:hypothetical protein
MRRRTCAELRPAIIFAMPRPFRWFHIVLMGIGGLTTSQRVQYRSEQCPTLSRTRLRGPSTLQVPQTKGCERGKKAVLIHK